MTPGARAKAAESALAEATALLERAFKAQDWLKHDDFVQNQVGYDLEAFLSRTPAPAATVTPDQIRQALELGVRDARIVAGDPVVPAPAAKAEPLKDQLKKCEDELRRLGYGVEPIFVFTEDDAPPKFTSLTGDVCWDTALNRRRTFDFIRKVKNR